MKKMIISTLRPPDHFKKGTQGFILGTGSVTRSTSVKRGGTEKKVFSQFIPFIAGECHGYVISFVLTSGLYQGSTRGSSGYQNPLLVREDEMEWLEDNINRIGDRRAEIIQKLADEGDEDAYRIMSYVEAAFHFTRAQRLGELLESRKFAPTPLFERQKFLDAVIMHMYV
jgi:hypothetical protein